MKVVLFAPHFTPAQRAGGPIRTLTALIRTAPIASSISILTRDRDVGAHDRLNVERNRWIEGPDGTEVRYTSVEQPFMLLAAMWTSRRRAQVIYLNSFFDAQMAILPIVLHRLKFWGGARLLIAPRGQFSEGALALKKHKKMLYLKLYRLLDSPGTVWHASSQFEADDIQAAIGGSPTVLIREDETDLPSQAISIPAERDETRGPALRLVFLSRISPKKGLTILIRALAGVTHEVNLDVVGPAEDAREIQSAKELSEKLPPHAVCTFLPPVDSEQSVDLFRNYDLFAFPTAGENFGHVIAESLAASCPVMVTDTTPWSGTIRSGGGVIVESRDPSAWTSAIEEYASHGRESWHEASESARGAYNTWANAPKRPHILDQLADLDITSH